jgi:hypothetical protein
LGEGEENGLGLYLARKMIVLRSRDSDQTRTQLKSYLIKLMGPRE